MNEPLSVSNDFLAVQFDPAKGILSLQTHKGAGFLSQSVTLSVNPPPIVQDVIDDVFGNGKAIVFYGADGDETRLMIFPSVPFVLVKPVFVNSGDGERIVDMCSVLQAKVQLGVPFAELRALGTAGLSAPDDHSGSYVFLSIVDPGTRNGVVAAWLTHERGSGIVFSGRDGESATLGSRIDYGRLPVPAGSRVEGEIFAVGYFDDARLGLEQWAELTARKAGVRLPPQQDGYCTWYSDQHGGASDALHIAETAEFCARELKPFGFQFVQIDDKWQAGKERNGPAKVFGQVNPDGPYPDGMQATAEKIAETGLVPGLWWMPFSGDHEDPFFEDKQDGFVQKDDGEPYVVTWGGTSLDLSHPKTRDYVAELSRKMSRDWGYTYFKMDGLWTGTASELLYVNNAYKQDDLGAHAFHDRAMTPIEAYRSGFRLVREAAGDGVFFLGCCISQNMRSFGASIGMVDAMRIGPDNGSSFDSLKLGPWHGTNRYFLHGRVWYNDPDPIYVRASMPMPHAQLICSWVSLSGQLHASSDWLPGLPPDRLDLLKRALPSHGRLSRPVDLFDRDCARIWHLRDDASGVRRDVVGLFNWNSDSAERLICSTQKMGLPAARSYVAFDYWANRFIPPFSDELDVVVPPGACRVWAVRAAADHPQVLSTSRHITQGVVDILEERWDEDAGLMSLKCRVVANDFYELRVVTPMEPEAWVARCATMASCTMDIHQDGPMVRVSSTPESSGDVSLQISFTRGAVDFASPAPVTDAQAEASFGSVSLAWTCHDALSSVLTREPTFAVGEHVLFETHFRDCEVQADTSYRYTLSTRNYAGQTSASVTMEARTPARPERPPLPPAPTVQCSQLPPKSATSGWGEVVANHSCDGNPLTLDGVAFANGMGVHAESLLVYTIPRGMKRFVAYVGLDDEVKMRKESSVQFRVYGDVEEMGEGRSLLAESPLLCDRTLRTWCFDMPLSDRFKAIHLVVNDGGDGTEYDHANWVNAGFIE